MATALDKLILRPPSTIGIVITCSLGILFLKSAGKPLVSGQNNKTSPSSKTTSLYVDVPWVEQAKILDWSCLALNAW